MDKLIIGDLTFFGHCGITPGEQETGQRFSVTLEILADISVPARSDDLKDAFDYAAISQRLVEVGNKERFHLIEKMAERLAEILIKEFGAPKVRLSLRKHHPPIEQILAYSGIEIEREA